jgi:hypothetical protein
MKAILICLIYTLWMTALGFTPAYSLNIHWPF